MFRIKFWREDESKKSGRSKSSKEAVVSDLAEAAKLLGQVAKTDSAAIIAQITIQAEGEAEKLDPAGLF